MNFHAIKSASARCFSCSGPIRFSRSTSIRVRIIARPAIDVHFFAPERGFYCVLCNSGMIRSEGTELDLCTARDFFFFLDIWVDWHAKRVHILERCSWLCEGRGPIPTLLQKLHILRFEDTIKKTFGKLS